MNGKMPRRTGRGKPALPAWPEVRLTISLVILAAENAALAKPDFRRKKKFQILRDKLAAVWKISSL
jgi:hypothetical protein